MSSTDFNKKASSSQCMLQNGRHRSSRSASPIDICGYVVITRSPSTKVLLMTNIHYHGSMISTPGWQEESNSRSWI